MSRFLELAFALALAAPVILLPAAAAASRSHAADAIRFAPGRSGGRLRRAVPAVHFGDRRHHRRHAARFRNVRARPRSAAARPWCSIPTAARCSAPSRSAATSAGSGSTPRSAARVDLDADDERHAARQAVAARRLRIDVRLRAARRRAPHGAAGSARDGASDLARRPPRRSDRGELFGRGSGAGAARHRPAGAIHRRDGRPRSNCSISRCAFRRGSRCMRLTRGRNQPHAASRPISRRTRAGDGRGVAAGAGVAAACRA